MRKRRAEFSSRQPAVAKQSEKGLSLDHGVVFSQEEEELPATRMSISKPANAQRASVAKGLKGSPGANNANEQLFGAQKSPKKEEIPAEGRPQPKKGGGCCRIF